MQSWRSQIRPLGCAAAMLFAVAIGLPRPGFLRHEHAGGQHTHVHEESAVGFWADGDAPADDLPFARNDDEIDLRPAAAHSTDGPTWQRNHHHRGTHVHLLPLFHLVALVAVAIVWIVARFELLRIDRFPVWEQACRRTFGARAPPFVRFS